MSFLVKKVNNKLIFRDKGGYETRNKSTFWCIEKADQIYKWKDFDEIEIHTDDYERNLNHYTFSKNNSYNKLVPDFNFHAWPQVGISDYGEMIKQIDTIGQKNFKINKVGWIGCVETSLLRKRLLRNGERNKDLFDIIPMRWKKTDTCLLDYNKYISLPDLVEKYSVLIDIEGRGYSGRLKYLLWSHRPIIIIDRPHKEFFFKDLIEWEHYIPVKRDLTDLLDNVKWCINNHDKAKIIAENAYIFSKKNLTREACFEHWNEIITS